MSNQRGLCRKVVLEYDSTVILDGVPVEDVSGNLLTEHVRRVLYVWENDTEIEISRTIMLTEIPNGIPAKEKYARYSYVNMAACTTEPPTFEEVLHIPTKQLVKWEQAAKELNPEWFPETIPTLPDKAKKKN